MTGEPGWSCSLRIDQPGRTREGESEALLELAHATWPRLKTTADEGNHRRQPLFDSGGGRKKIVRVGTTSGPDDRHLPHSTDSQPPTTHPATKMTSSISSLRGVLCRSLARHTLPAASIAHPLPSTPLPLLRLSCRPAQPPRPPPTAAAAARSFHVAPALRSTKPAKKKQSKSEAGKAAKQLAVAQKARAARRDKGTAQEDPKLPAFRRVVLQVRRVPAPLRMGRNRHLRHWTIHRAWNLLRRQQREARARILMRQWQSMRAACEELRLTAGPGARDEGYLYRVAMEKKGVYGHNGIPIEYARPQTETPARQPWNHDWKR